MATDLSSYLNFKDPNMSYNTSSSQTPKVGATNADKNFTYANAGIQALGSIASAYANVEAYKAQLKADTANRIANMNSVMDSYEYNAYKLEEDYKLLDSQFANKVSERTLQAMKDTATLKAMAAETGTSGGSTSEAVLTAKMDEMFDLAVINSQRKAALGGILRNQEAARIDAVNQFKTLASGGVNYKANLLVSGLSGATNALGSLLTTMPNSVRAELFDMGTAANKIDENQYRPQGT